MSLNLNSKDTFFVFDEHGMLIVPSDQSWEKRSWWEKLWDKILKREWISTWENKSWKDSLGRTVLAWIVYDTPIELENALDQCWHDGKLYRHPAHDEFASRDHHSYNIISMNMFIKQSKAYKNYVKKLPFMRGIYLWMHSLTGNRLAEWMYYMLYIPGAILGNWWLRKCRKWGRIGPERDNDWWIGYEDETDVHTRGLNLQHSLNKWQKFWARIIFQTIPAYPLHNKGWQLYVMPESRRKERLKRILLKRVGKSNIMLRLLFGDTTVTQKEVDSFPNMTGYRTGVYLDETCRRTIRELTPQEAEFNTYEKDLVIYLFEKDDEYYLVI